MEEDKLHNEDHGLSGGGGDPNQDESSMHDDDDDDDEQLPPPPEKHPALHVIGPAYARNKKFWISIAYSTIPQGLFMALVALAFFNVFEQLSKATWLTHEYEHALESTPALLLEGLDLEEGTAAGTLAAEGEGGGGSGEHHGSIDMLRIGNGQWWYVGLLAGSGLCLGLIKVVWTYALARSHPFPDDTPGMLQELKELRAHDALTSIPIICCSAVGLGMGASVGPEAALGCVGVAVGSTVAGNGRRVGGWIRRWRGSGGRSRSSGEQAVAASSSSETDNPAEGGEEAERGGDLAAYLFPDLTDDAALCALDGMAAGFGALFPAQYLSPMMIHEIGFLWGPEGAQTKYHFMETLVRTGVASSVAYALFVGLADMTFLEQATLPTAAYEFLPTIEVVDMLSASILGIISGGVGLLGFILLGGFKALGAKCNATLNSLGAKVGMPERFLGMLFTPVIGGTLLGLLAKACPLTLGDGVHQLGFVITHARDLGAGDLIATMFAKIAAVSIALGFGFVGGQIFPLLFAGTCLGSVAALWVPQVPVLVAVTSCMVAVPCAFLPALLTLTTVVSMVLALGGAGTTPIFVASIMSYTTVCGVGVVQDVIEKAAGGTPASSDSTKLPVPKRSKVLDGNKKEKLVEESPQEPA